MSGSWGGSGRGGGAYPKDPAAALDAAIRTLERRLDVARKLGVGTYAERQATFAAIDKIAEAAEIYLCEAQDYPEEA